MLIDSHSHVHFLKEFPDQEEVLLRAREAGVLKQVMIGCNLEDSIEAARFAGPRDNIFWTAGIHPHDALQATPENLQRFRNLISRTGEFDYLSKAPVAIGEIGLDYFRNLSPAEAQQEVFKEQLKIAAEFDLPVVVHIRDAYEDALRILEKSGNSRIVLHCFSGNLQVAELAWGRGYLTSFAGVVTYPKNLELQEVARRAPESQFVVETDCPYLAPQKYRGQRNEPAFVAETARFIAELRGVKPELIAEMTTANAERFLGI
jgi:TatD DNase family protein